MKWHAFRKSCNKIVHAPLSGTWVNETIDTLDFWDRQYHLRVIVCQKVTRNLVYCDEHTTDAKVVARSQTLTFRTKKGEGIDSAVL